MSPVSGVPARQASTDTAPAPYPTYLVRAIVVTVLGACVCCGVGALPGTVAIYYGVLSDSRFTTHDLEGARKASRLARLWCWVGVAVLALGAAPYAVGLWQHATGALP